MARRAWVPRFSRYLGKKEAGHEAETVECCSTGGVLHGIASLDCPVIMWLCFVICEQGKGLRVAKEGPTSMGSWISSVAIDMVQ